MLIVAHNHLPAGNVRVTAIWALTAQTPPERSSNPFLALRHKLPSLSIQEAFHQRAVAALVNYRPTADRYTLQQDHKSAPGEGGALCSALVKLGSSQ